MINELKMVSEELRNKMEKQTWVRQENVEINAWLTQMEILTNNAAQ